MKTTSSTDPDLLKLAAQMYYIDKLSQSEIARILSMSQAKVCRLLLLARKQGLVQITVAAYTPQDEALEKALCNVFSLRHAVVVRNLPVMQKENISKRVGYFGAPALAKMIQSNQLIGLTGGRTLSELVRCLDSFSDPQGLRVVQLMGSIDVNAYEHDASEVSRKMANQSGGTLYSLNSPIFVENAQFLKNFMSMVQVKSIWKLYHEMDVALVGIGLLKNSIFIDRRAIGMTDLAYLQGRGAIGETCGRFFDVNGQECESEYKDRVVSIQLDELRRLPLVIGVTVGADRAEAVVAAMRGGLISALIIDEDGARGALEFASKH